MGRIPTPQQHRLPRLTAQQRELLLMTIGAGHCAHFLTARADSAWAVRAGRGKSSVVLTYDLKVGRRLERLGYIAVDPDPKRAEARGPTGFIGRRYVATPAGVARVRGREE